MTECYFPWYNLFISGLLVIAFSLCFVSGFLFWFVWFSFVLFFVCLIVLL